MAVLSKRAASTHVSMQCMHPICSMSLYLFFLLLFVPSKPAATLPLITPEEVLVASSSKCVVLISSKQTTKDPNHDLHTIADVAFRSEPKIKLGACDLLNFVWPSGKRLEIYEKGAELTAVVFPRLAEDRTCLQKPNNYAVYPAFFGYNGPSYAESFTEFVNDHCNTFRKTDGGLTIEGYHKDYLLENLFSVKELPDSVTISQIFSNQNQEQQYCIKLKDETNCFDQSSKKKPMVYSDAPKCARIPLPSKKDFIDNYLTRSKPVIITGATQHWPALSKWTNDFFQKQYGEREVHVKLTPKGEYEGIEPADIWETYKTFQIPPKVLEQLPYPDLVVVRPAGVNMNFSHFLEFIRNVSEGLHNDASAYLEYTSIDDYFPELKADLSEMTFFRNVLKLMHLNIWLSDGNTLGKTHFDPFDNFLCQLSGQKEVTLFEPHNDFLYEAHIPEAILSYNATSNKFRRSKLLDSTSMVMTPVDILKPHLERFPKFGSAHPMSCTIKEGEVLFLPAFWWHEVQSRPSSSEHRNLAVNFWYEPFFQKEFPCPECQLDVNPKYRHLL